jgi:acyl-CoA synthetase (AMP-forming)/AMP-acid ligase II
LVYRAPFAIIDRAIRFAVVGCSRISGRHIDALKEHGARVELAAVCDTDDAALEAATAALGVPGYRTLEDLLAGSEADVISLCTPSGLHPQQTVQIARAGRHVVTEKPIAVRLVDGKRMAGACDEAGLRQVICGSEPVPERLLVEFEQVLGPLGVPARALKPVYGLAEATLAASMPAKDAMPRLKHARGARVRKVGLGTPLDGVQVTMRGPDGAGAAEREVGAVFVRGPSLLAGRLRRGKFRERRGEWLDTGDLGFLAHGELFTTGRSKDLTIPGGRNLSPERIEEVACDAMDGRRAAAFGAYSERLGTERVVVILELPGCRIADAPARDQVRLAVRNAARDAGYPLDEVLLVRRGVLPRTSSGKIRRGEARSRYLSGCYREPGT